MDKKMTSKKTDELLLPAPEKTMLLPKEPKKLLITCPKQALKKI